MIMIRRRKILLVCSAVAGGILLVAAIILLLSLRPPEGSMLQRVNSQLQVLAATQEGAAFAYLVLLIGFLLAFIFYYFYAREQHLHNQEKDVFLSLAAHQLRTPLGAMRWNLEVLLAGDEGSLATGVRTVLKDIYRSNQHLVLLVNNLLEISRINQGRKKFVFIQQYPKTVIAEAVKMIEPLAQAKKIRIRVQGANAKSKIWLEEKHFYEVVTNLLSNAVKYSKVRGKIVISSELTDGFWQLSVADNGVGIPQADQANVFSNFYRASNAMTGNPEGEGIGLYMVKMFVKTWGGRVWFESSEGQGSTFYIRLPLKNSLYLKKN